MSAAQVAGRMGITRAAIYQAERNEKEGAITIAQMRKIAEAMDAEFIYALVPKFGSVEAAIKVQAYKKAEQRVRQASAHMALEDQALDRTQTNERTELLAEELVRKMPSDFWDAS